ncbi:MAG: GntR family transcriptional regulator, partial [Clostridium sp.]|nr:GntR family transcriptional regulator [Clostridium sp.]
MDMSYGIASTDDILNDLCRNIRRLKFEPGAKISENEMAEFYNVSRSSIRTVFSKLEQMLLIKRFPQIGTYINPFDVEYIGSALYVRALIELDAIEKIIALDKKEYIITKLEENIALQNEYIDTKDY